MNSTQILRRVSWYQMASLAVLALGALVFRPHALPPLFAGGLLMALNFWLLRTLTRKAFSSPKPKIAYALLLAIKMVAVLGVMAFLILVVRLSPIPFALGLATLFVGLGVALVMHTGASQAHSPTAKGSFRV
jgi:hypothetical protein